MALTHKHAALLEGALLFVAATALVALALPLLAALSIVGRIAFPVLLLIAVVLLLAIPTLRRGVLFARRSPAAAHKGFRIGSGIGLHRAHGWARQDTWREVTVGADDLLARLLGPVEAVALAPVGASIEAGQPVCELRRGERVLTLRSPVAGTVTQVHERLVGEPSLVHEAPYGAGWIARIRPAGAWRRRLLEGRAAQSWFRGEVDALVSTLSPVVLPTAAMQDGGPVVADLHDRIDDETWQRLVARFGGDDAAAG